MSWHEVVYDEPIVPPLTLDADRALVRAALLAPRPYVAAVLSEERLRQCRSISMLHPDTLAMLAFFATRTCGPVLEIGPFLGGSTAAICAGLERRGRDDTTAVVTIEVGGARKDLERLSTGDIVADLRRNLARFGFADRVSIVNRIAADPRTLRDVKIHLDRIAGRPPGEGRFGMIVIDADGLVEALLGRFAPLLRDDCLVVLDDYVTTDAKEKETALRSFVEEQVRAGRLREMAILPYGTWFGQIGGGDARAWLASRRETIEHDRGHCHRVALLLESPADSAGHEGRSKSVLREDGRIQGPAHALHDEIRSLGGGRYSLWMHDSRCEDGLYGAHLYFSSSDGSDPRTNGRRYELEVDGRTIDLRMA